MRTSLITLVLATAIAHAAAAQHAEQAAAPSPGANAQQIAACVQSQQAALGIVEAVDRHIEVARQTNQPAAMRAAVDDLQAALVEMRTALQTCDPLQAAAAAAGPQAGHNTANMQQAPPVPPQTPVTNPGSTTPAPGAKPAAPAAPMDHSKMPMGGNVPVSKPAAAAGAKPAAPAAPMDHSKMPMGGNVPVGKPAAAAGAKPAAPAAPMDHSKMPMGGNAIHTSPAAAPPPQAIDPVCGPSVDPSTAPRATYQDRTYSFCSEQHRQLFQKDSQKYAPKAAR